MILQLILSYGSEIWGTYDSINLKKWEKDPAERRHTLFYKYYFGLNRRAPNIAARNETGRLPSKFNVLPRIIKFWLRLVSLPEDSVVKQCLNISNQLANEAKSSFMLTVNKIIKNYLDDQNYPHNINAHNCNEQIMKHNLQKLKCHFSNNMK